MDSLIQWYRNSQSVDWRGHRITVRSYGLPASTATLLIHGFPTASWDWHAIWDALCARGPVLAFDMLGFGYSAKPHPWRYRLTEQADLAADLCQHFGIEQAHLLAHDYGDTVAQELLTRTAGPEIASCFLLNGGIIPDHHRPLAIQRLLSGPLGPLAARFMTRRRFGRNFSRIFGPASQPTEEELDICWQLIEHHDGRRVMPALSRYRAERRQHATRWIEALAEATVPCEVLIGERDPISGAHMADAIDARCPHTPVRRLERIGHYPQLEDPAFVVQAYGAFRDRVADPDRSVASEP